jgi:hypothetical protein
MLSAIHCPSESAMAGVLNATVPWSGSPKKQAFSPATGLVAALKAPAILRFVAGTDGRTGVGRGVGDTAGRGATDGEVTAAWLPESQPTSIATTTMIRPSIRIARASVVMCSVQRHVSTARYAWPGSVSRGTPTRSPRFPLPGSRIARSTTRPPSPSRAALQASCTNRPCRSGICRRRVAR